MRRAGDRTDSGKIVLSTKTDSIIAFDDWLQEAVNKGERL